MFWLLWKLITLPISVPLTALRLVIGTVRLVGVRRLALLVVGGFVGLLIAPKTGERFRQELADKIDQARRPAPAPIPADVPPVILPTR